MVSNCTSRQRGFTMTELITVIVIVGILGSMVAPRFFDKGTFDSRGFYDQTISTLRYAQKVAIAQHRVVCVVYTSNEIGLFASDCSTPLDVMAPQLCAADGMESQHKVCPPNGVTITSTPGSFSFTALGSTPTKRILKISGYATDITVEAETGYVH